MTTREKRDRERMILLLRLRGNSLRWIGRQLGVSHVLVWKTINQLIKESGGDTHALLEAK